MIGHESSDVIEGGTSHGGAGSGNSSATCAVFPHIWAVITETIYYADTRQKELRIRVTGFVVLDITL